MEGIFRTIGQLIGGPEISLFHEFKKPPYGGGNQFLIALEGELMRRSLSVGRNRIGKRTKACLFNSYNFDFARLAALKKKYPDVRMIHRVDGPISAYRGTEPEEDRKIWEMNHELADASVFQSRYSLDKHVEMGLVFKDATVITNAPDAKIFNSADRIAPPDGTRKIRLIATSWSDNPKKGGPTLAWLDLHLEHEKYELTFVGRTKADFTKANIIPAVPSEELGDILRKHDIYIAASEDDPCSNALIEALACGLPAAYRRSGGHPELVKDGGEGFSTNEELLLAVEKVASDYPAYQAKIEIASLREVTDEYLRVFKL